jgi:hypothetical protein
MIFTWTLDNHPSAYSRDEVTAAIARACDAWSKALSGKVRFQLLEPDEAEEESADIMLGFAKIENPRWVAEHKKEGNVSLIRFRDTNADGTAHTWAISRTERFFGLRDSCLLNSTLHELGHAMGCPDHVPPGQGCMEEQRGFRYTKPTRADVELVLKHLKP